MAFPLIFSKSLVESTKQILRSVWLGEALGSSGSTGLAGLMKRALEKHQDQDAAGPDADSAPVHVGRSAARDIAKMALMAKRGAGVAGKKRGGSSLPLIPAALPQEPAAQPEKQERNMARKAREAAEREAALAKQKEFHPPSHFGAFTHDTPAPHEAHGDHDQHDKEFRDVVHHPNAEFDEVVHHGGGVQPTFSTNYRGGLNTIFKLSGDYDSNKEVQARGPRHRAIHRLLAHMGYGHMAMPGDSVDLGQLNTAAPGVDQDFRYGVNLDKKKGVPGFVMKYADLGMSGGPNDGGELANYSHKFIKQNVDPNEVLHMSLLDAMATKKDGHDGNYLVTRKNPKTGRRHLVSIDHDYTFGFGGRGAYASQIRSEFLAPHSQNYYSHFIKDIPGYESGEIGHNYPPRARKTLEWLAAGGHNDTEHGLGLGQEDSDILQGVAQSMLKNGFEKHLSNYSISR